MEQTITVFGIILHPNTSHILLVPSADGWTLPHFARAHWKLWSCVSDVNDAMRRQLGMNPVTLRCHAIDCTAADNWLLYGIENTDPGWAPPAGCRWASCAEILTGSLLPARLADCVTSWFAWEARSEARRVPWYRRGWSPPAMAWVEQQVVRQGMALIGPPRQRRTWQRSTVWEIPTTEGALFFKALPAFFRQEIPLTDYLGRLFPDAVPRMLATEYARGWMIMANAGDTTLGQSSELEDWSAALQRYAEMQVELSRHVEQLTALGCPCFPPAQLGDASLELMADREALTAVDVEFQLSADECALLRERHEDIAAVGQTLAHSSIPLSLDHGDLWSAQILQRAGQPVLIDWSDAGVTMPFVSLFKYLIPREVMAVFPGNPAAERTLRDAYLDPWKSYASQDQLVDLYQQAQAIAALHYAVVNYCLLLPRMEVRWEQANMISYFLKRLIGVM